jgi:hypothetical protein
VSDGRPFTLRMLPTDHVSSLTIGIKLPVSTSPSLCIVLAHLWPGWLSCLSSYNFCCTRLFCEMPQAPWIIHLASAYPGCSILDLRTTPPGSIVPPTSDHHVFFQRNASLLSWLHRNVSNCVMGALDSSRETAWLPDWFSTTLSYFLYGGLPMGIGYLCVTDRLMFLYLMATYAHCGTSLTRLDESQNSLRPRQVLTTHRMSSVVYGMILALYSGSVYYPQLRRNQSGCSVHLCIRRLNGFTGLLHGWS